MYVDGVVHGCHREFVEDATIVLDLRYSLDVLCLQKTQMEARGRTGEVGGSSGGVALS
ncbi:hypothetical protein GCM10007964_70560 [Sphaerisporangium melleum]|uniref:Uncharacterized protein n=1 Tax=Sphaerisporangium melleum TaxID=321316 RepID=A0A917RQW0_9ACTN|nr:hypothetical protein GCM10007964_70560 [Sphaerisporangium melleum]